MLRLSRAQRPRAILSSRRGRRGVSLGAAAAVVATLALAIGPQSAAGDTQHAVANDLPPFTGQDSAAYVAGSTTVAKAKTTIKIPTLLLRVDANSSFELTPPPPNAKKLVSHSQAWAVSPPGSAQPFGVFPAFKTTVLAFGAIPVTATIHLGQTFLDNQPQPLQVQAQGTVVAPFDVFLPTLITGQLTMRISDVTVDQVPLQVGPDCHTSQPLNLNLSGIDPSYDLFIGGPLTGTTTIPPFIGCHSGTENLDPLLTGMISGPGNAVSMKQGALGSWVPPAGCNEACTLP